MKFVFALWTREMVAHQGQVRRKIECKFGGASVGATRHHLPEAIAPCDRTRRGPGAALRWKILPEQRQRIQMVLLRESGMTQPLIAAAKFGIVRPCKAPIFSAPILQLR